MNKQLSGICRAVLLGASVFVGQHIALAQTFSYAGPAVSIPDNTPAGVNIPITVTGAGPISDLDFRFDTAGTCDATLGNPNAGVSHTFIGDLTFKLTSPAGTTVTFLARRGGTRENICSTLLDDDSGAPNVSTVTSVSGSPMSGTFTPETSGQFSLFDGQNPNGTWNLNVSDNATIDTGAIRLFSLIITSCVSLTCPANITVSTASNQCTNTISYPAPVAVGSCGTITCSPSSGGNFAWGTNTVSCQTAGAVRSCSFNINVVDSQAPSIVCPSNASVSTTSNVGAAIEFASPTVSDNCPGTTGFSCDRVPGSIFPLGTTVVNCSTADASGHTVGCQFTASVNGNVNVDNLGGEKPFCDRGAKITKAVLTLKKLGGTSGDDSVSLSGIVKTRKSLFSQLSGRTNGAQIHLVDVGNSNSTLFELSERTELVLGGEVGTSATCGTGDGWTKPNTYVNASNRLGAPTCVERSANGLTKLSLSSRDKVSGESTLKFSTKNSTLFQNSVKGPISLTVVFGSNANGAAGQCATAKFKRSQCIRKKGTLTCSN